MPFWLDLFILRLLKSRMVQLNVSNVTGSFSELIVGRSHVMITLTLGRGFRWKMHFPM